MFDAGKTKMIGLPYGEKNYDDMLIRFHTIPACYGQTDRRTDGQTDGQNCYINRASAHWRAIKNAQSNILLLNLNDNLKFSLIYPYDLLAVAVAGYSIYCDYIEKALNAVCRENDVRRLEKMNNDQYSRKKVRNTVQLIYTYNRKFAAVLPINIEPKWSSNQHQLQGNGAVV